MWYCGLQILDQSTDRQASKGKIHKNKNNPQWLISNEISTGPFKCSDIFPVIPYEQWILNAPASPHITPPAFKAEMEIK